jgi:hypothetical protein
MTVPSAASNFLSVETKVTKADKREIKRDRDKESERVKERKRDIKR